MNKYQNVSERYFDKQNEYSLMHGHNSFFSDDPKVNYMFEDSMQEDSDQMDSSEQNFDILNWSYSQIFNSILKTSITKSAGQNEQEVCSNKQTYSEASLNRSFSPKFEEIKDWGVSFWDNLDTFKSDGLTKVEISNETKQDEKLVKVSDDNHIINSQLLTQPSSKNGKKTKTSGRKRKPRKNLQQRSDVVNKGSLRILRRVFRHLFSNIFVHTRKRSTSSKMSQFRANLNGFMELILTNSEESQIDKSSPEYILNRELVGRMINMKMYAHLSIKYKSSRSSDIKKFVSLYDKCWINYSHELFNKLVWNDMFKKIINLYNIVKQKGLLIQYNIDSETNRRYINNVTAIQDYCLVDE